MAALDGTVSRDWTIDRVLNAICEVGSTSDLKYEVKKLQQYREGLLSMSPFQVGDRVVLTDPPKVERSSGWYGSRHFLVTGAQGEVREVDWITPTDAESGAGGYFSLYVMFDGESFLSDHYEDHKAIPKDSPRREVFTPRERRHVFGMAARRVATMPDSAKRDVLPDRSTCADCREPMAWCRCVQGDQDGDEPMDYTPMADAAEIDRLRAENERLREVRPCVCAWYDEPEGPAREPVTTDPAALGNPIEAWKRRGRELNALYDALAKVVEEPAPGFDAAADILALGAQRDRLRVEKEGLYAEMAGLRVEIARLEEDYAGLEEALDSEMARWRRFRAESEALKAERARPKPTLADERSFMCEDCASQADFEVITLRAENERLREDLAELGAAFATIWSQALNGVVCEPGQAEIGRHNCRPCRDAWKAGTDVLASYDSKYANVIRTGAMFQPDFSRPSDDQGASDA